MYKIYFYCHIAFIIFFVLILYFGGVEVKKGNTHFVIRSATITNKKRFALINVTVILAIK